MQKRMSKKFYKDEFLERKEASKKENGEKKKTSERNDLKQTLEFLY